MKKRLLVAALILIALALGWCAQQQRIGPFAVGRSNAVITWAGSSNPDSVRAVVVSIVRQEPAGLLCRMGTHFVFASWEKQHHSTVGRVVDALRRNASAGFEYTVARYDDSYESFNPDSQECR